MHTLNPSAAKAGKPLWLPLAACLFVCLLIAAIFVVAARSPKPALTEALRSALTLHDGKLYLESASGPFTGLMIERYEKGALKSRSSISNGVLHGLSEGWHPNGQLQITEHFSAGVSHGLRTKWHENGRKLSEVMVREGKLHGTFKRWAEDGTASEVVEIRDGQPDGISRAYYPSGCLRAEVRLRKGKVLESKFWSDGEQSTPAPDLVASPR